MQTSRARARARAGTTRQGQRHSLADLPSTLIVALLSSAFLPSTALAASPSFVPPLSALSALFPRQAIPLDRRATSLPTYSNSSQLLPTTANSSTSATEGRYGHSAVFIPSSNSLLLIGGQVGDNGTVITADVLQFNLASTLLWGFRPVSAITNNPAPAVDLETGLPPHAWAASAVDASNRTWLIGGVTQDCEKDAVAYTLAGAGGGAGWATAVATPRAPPRRRQAHAVAVANTTTGGADVFVFGGIADQYTCSQETIGYLGVDRWDTVGGEVETFKWDAPVGWVGVFDAPVSDHSATVLADGTSIVVVGGQTAAGALVEMGTVLVFDTKLRGWTSRNTTGPTPDPRMGHIAVPLESGAVLIHGGVGLDRSPVASVHILTPPSNLAASSTSPWTWSTSFLSNHSQSAPSRAWHTATLIPGGTIVVAFGIDAVDGSPSSDFFFLSLDEEGNCTWDDTYDGAAAAEEQAAPPILAILNPKAQESTASEALATAFQAVSATTSSKTSSSPLASSSAISSSASSANAATASQNFAAATAASAKKRSIAAGVGSIAGVAAALGLAAILLRRRFAASNRRGVQLASDHSPRLAAPLVSTLLYTRPVAGRMLSLGSTLSTARPQSPTPSSTFSSSSHPSSPGSGLSRDPFSDAHVVSEMGQLRPLPLSHSSPNAPAMASLPSVASVTSAPFLHALTRSESRDSDSYTSLPPSPGRSLRSVRSERAQAIEEEELAKLRAGERWDVFAAPTGETGAVGRGLSMFEGVELPFPGGPPGGRGGKGMGLRVRNADPFG